MEQVRQFGEAATTETTQEAPLVEETPASQEAPTQDDFEAKVKSHPLYKKLEESNRSISGQLKRLARDEEFRQQITSEVGGVKKMLETFLKAQAKGEDAVAAVEQVTQESSKQTQESRRLATARGAYTYVLGIAKDLDLNAYEAPEFQEVRNLIYEADHTGDLSKYAEGRARAAEIALELRGQQAKEAAVEQQKAKGELQGTPTRAPVRPGLTVTRDNIDALYNQGKYSPAKYRHFIETGEIT